MNKDLQRTSKIGSESPALLGMARSLRREATPTEARVWELLRGKRLNGLKFRRQQVLEGYIVDFFCFEKRLCIELDGAPHEKDDKKAKDQERDGVLRMKGYRVLRMMNDEVNADIQGSRMAILGACA